MARQYCQCPVPAPVPPERLHDARASRCPVCGLARYYDSPRRRRGPDGVQGKVVSDERIRTLVLDYAKLLRVKVPNPYLPARFRGLSDQELLYGPLKADYKHWSYDASMWHAIRSGEVDDQRHDALTRIQEVRRDVNRARRRYIDKLMREMVPESIMEGIRW